jgi:3-phenylpropionate/trans-cinnamate dioxygenase ferredoxin reductase subunit
MRLVIVGGGPAGLAAARAYREAGGDGLVELVTAEAHHPYERPPLTKDLARGETEAEELFLEEDGWFADHDVSVHRARRATRLDRERRVVVLADGGELPYDGCVLATGSIVPRPPIPGAEDPQILTVRRLEDGLRLRELGARRARVIVVGAGFIACEAAASLAQVGAPVALVAPEALPQAARLGETAGRRIRGWLQEAGVELHLERQVERLAPGGVEIEHGPTLHADAIVLATGVRPAAELAEAAGLALDDGAVAADPALRSSDPAVLVAGDVAAAEHAVAGRRLHVEHWGDALVQGEIAGRVAAGEDATWRAAPGFWSTIGGHTLKLAAWGDGWDTDVVEADEDDRLVVRLERDGRTVGVLSSGDDDAYERGRERLEAGER